MANLLWEAGGAIWLRWVGNKGLVSWLGERIGCGESLLGSRARIANSRERGAWLELGRKDYLRGEFAREQGTNSKVAAAGGCDLAFVRTTAFKSICYRAFFFLSIRFNTFISMS